MRLRVGLIGCGEVAERYPAAIHANPGRLVLEAVSDVDTLAGRNFAQRFGVRFVPSLEAFLASPLDLVCICTPSDTHAALAAASLEAGFDVVVEHPLALSVARSEQLCRLAASRDRRLFVVRQRRFLPSVQRLKRVLAARALGEVDQISAAMLWRRSPEYYERRPWRTRPENGGVVRNQASHFLDILVYLFGEPRSVSGVLGNLRHRLPVEDSFSGSVQFTDTVTAAFSCTTAAPGNWTHLTITGARGEITLSGRGWERFGTSFGLGGNGSRAGDHADFLDRVARSLAGEAVEVVAAGDSVPAARTIDTIYRTAHWDSERLRAQFLPLFQNGHP